jgi:plasmid stabilization system protein ParE
MRRAADNPLMHRERQDYPGHPRRINVMHYAILYEPLPDGDGICVRRVIHDRRDLLRHLSERSMNPTGPPQQANRLSQ